MSELGKILVTWSEKHVLFLFGYRFRQTKTTALETGVETLTVPVLETASTALNEGP